MTDAELRARLLRLGLHDALPRSYYYRGVDAFFDEALPLLADYHHRREAAKKAAEKAHEAAEEGLEELTTRVKEILREATHEDLDGDPVVDRTALLQRLRGAIDADYAIESAAVLGHVRAVSMHPQAGHHLLAFPHGVEWCDRCGLLVRPGSKKRYYHPGLGEVKALPPCAPLAKSLPSPPSEVMKPPEPPQGVS